MLIRPFIDDPEKSFIFKQCSMFNDIIEEIVTKYRHSHVISVKLLDDHSLFDKMGTLSPNGRVVF